ncbi:GNAT family N-acetyltransferase [Stappia albiluteola]|uniref:GNAT family N-acetyltransferase n=1 Tax=Stappia albiluteola TaxID=2758565 RepID=UPI001F1EF9F2|nr:GNAT family N-acetyltransferase [Stappia albiluteola]
MTAQAEDTRDFQLRVVSSLAEVPANVWDGLANPGWKLEPRGRLAPAGSLSESGSEVLESDCEGAESPRQVPAFNPFISHAFLSALEESGCATQKTGWLGQHLLLEEIGGPVHAALPCYLKNHSQGEYVFDHGWADAFFRAGGNYYPKLQCSVPFTPATGRRFLTGPTIDRKAAIRALSGGLAELCRHTHASSAHITFMTEEEWEILGEEDYLLRTDQQFHWENEGYGNFDDFLAALASRKRKQIRKERREALEAGIEIEWVTGTDLTEAHWDAFYAFYMDTGSRKWGRPYLNRLFFSLLSEKLADRVLLIMAKRDGRPIAGALNLIGSDTLFGRNWGCLEDHPFLHFEVCYYQAIEFAISRGLKRVEAGAQGAHKLARGYLPTITRSAHWIAHGGLRRAVADYLEHERAAVQVESEVLSEHSPFRKTETPPDKGLQ